MDGSRRKLDPLQQLGVQALEDTPQKMGDPHLTSRLADAMAWAKRKLPNLVEE